MVIAESITTVCFDKTGTLTEDELVIYGYVEEKDLEDLKFGFNIELEQKQNDQIFKAFGTCHNNILVRDELKGDILDLTMFEFSSYKFENSNDPLIKFKVESPNLVDRFDILKIFEFESEQQRMSVVARDQNKNIFVFTKGAPEVIELKCNPQTITSKYQSSSESLTLQGLRLIAVAYKEIQENEIDLDRQQLESDLNFLGFLIFENKLKEDSTQTVRKLLDSHVKCRMVSGDNIYTCIQAGRESNIISPEMDCLMMDLDQHQNIYSKIIPRIRETFITKSQENYQMNQKMISLNNEIDKEFQNQGVLDRQMQILKRCLEDRNSSVAITGKLLQYLMNLNHIDGSNLEAQTGQSDQSILDRSENMKNKLLPNTDESLDNSSLNVNKNVFDKLIQECQIFSRIKPNQKSQIVQLMQDQKQKVLMIGDGANDCAAVRQADCGISFTQADAGFAAPYTVNRNSIVCVEMILRCGKSLMQNVLDTVKINMIQMAIQYIANTVMLSDSSLTNNAQGLFANLATMNITLIFLSSFGPSKKLVPVYVNKQFFNWDYFLSLIGQVIIASCGLLTVGLWTKQQSWYVGYDKKSDTDGGYHKNGQLATVVFMSMNI